MLMVPRPVSVRCSVNGSLAVDPECDSVPAVKLAWWTDRLANAALFTDVKSAGRVGDKLLHRGPVLGGPGGEVRARGRVRLGPELHELSAAATSVALRRRPPCRRGAANPGSCALGYATLRSAGDMRQPAENGVADTAA